ncbi:MULTISPECIES: hypothetical protein [unclassified Streptomyces]|uniref:hypothetical protein n=1 Tax=unclassified Streptomyces TaxID=2593676 RepID=UPI00278BB4C0|nr:MULTISPECIES: hypothetical protein [unclassified Streptomyces]
MTHSQRPSLPLSRRRVLTGAGAGAAAAALAVTAASPALPTPSSATRPAPRGAVPGAFGALGANFNENIVDIDVGELELGRATWIRGFVPVHHEDTGNPAEDPNVQRIVELGTQGYRTVCSIKFPYRDSRLPAAGSPEMAAMLDRLEPTLAALMDHVDILVVGNEPFIDTRPVDQTEALNVFHETAARRTIAHRAEHCGEDCRTTLYMGSLTALDLPKGHNPVARRWMRYVRETPEIKGVDIHPHVPAADDARPFLDYILPKMRDDQTFLVTEFSLVDLWGRHNEDPVPAAFTDAYGFPAGTKVWEVVQAAIDAPFPQRKWNAFLASLPWYEDNKHFLRHQMELYRGTGRLAVATYGYRQGSAMVNKWGPGQPPWLLNSVFAPYTVRPWADGSAGRGYAWLGDFRALQT